jgi:hypothetical protein
MELWTGRLWKGNMKRITIFCRTLPLFSPLGFGARPTGGAIQPDHGRGEPSKLGRTYVYTYNTGVAYLPSLLVVGLFPVPKLAPDMSVVICLIRDLLREKPYEAYQQQNSTRHIIICTLL